MATSAKEEAMVGPRESVVSSPHMMVNFAASGPSVMAWVRKARAFSGPMGSTHATESPQGVVVSAQEACGVHRPQC